MQRKRRITQGIVVGVVALLAIGIVASAVLLGRAGRSERVPTAATNVTVGGASVPFGIDGSAVQVGKADAKVTMDLWVDYSCPHCQEFEADSNDVITEKVASGELKVNYHNIQIVTAYGTQAGSAAACVATYAPESWWAFNAALYANHSAETDNWQGADLADFATQQGITNPDAQTCIKDERYTLVDLRQHHRGRTGGSDRHPDAVLQRRAVRDGERCRSRRQDRRGRQCRLSQWGRLSRPRRTSRASSADGVCCW